MTTMLAWALPLIEPSLDNKKTGLATRKSGCTRKGMAGRGAGARRHDGEGAWAERGGAAAHPRVAWGRGGGQQAGSERVGAALRRRMQGGRGPRGRRRGVVRTRQPAVGATVSRRQQQK